MQIYLIRHRESGKSYVGQTIWDFNTRYKAGNWIGTTTNTHLRAAGRKYGKEAFDVSILWEGQCSCDELDELEARYMREHNSLHPSGYNFKEAGRTGIHHYTHREYELIDAAGTLYQIANLRQFCKRLGLSYTAMLNMVSGRCVSSQGYALASTPIDQIIDPTEEWEIEHTVTGERRNIVRSEVPKAAAVLGVRPDTFWCLLHGDTMIMRGWKRIETTLPSKRLDHERRRREGVWLVHDSGDRILVTNLFAFARERGLDRKGLYKVANGKGIRSQGWRLATVTDPRAENIRRRGKRVTLRHRDTGETVEVKNVSEWCRQRGYNNSTIYAMLQGRTRHYKGWTLVS